MTPDPDLLRIEFLGLTVRHDPVDMPRDDIALFFASISDRYGLGRLEYHSDGGATLSSPDGAEFVLRPSQIASCAVTGLGYREGLERVVGLVEEAVERYEIGQLWIEDVTLVAVWDVEDAEVGPRAAGGQRPADRRRAPRAAGRRRGVRRACASGARRATPPWSAPSSRCTPSRRSSTSASSTPRASRLSEASSLREVADAVHGFLLGPLTSFILASARR